MVCSYVYSLEYGRTVNTLLAHDDAISQLSMQDNLLMSSSWDSTVKVSFMPLSVNNRRRHSSFGFRACMRSSMCDDVLKASEHAISHTACGNFTKT